MRVLFSSFLLASVSVLETSVLSSRCFQATRGGYTQVRSTQKRNMSCNSSSTSCLVAFVTCPSIEVARELSRNIVSAKLAACVNIIPQILSIYEWEGKVEEENEYLMVVKTSKDQFSSLTSYIEQNHPYDVPEVIATEIVDGSKKYLDWIISNTKPNQKKD